MELGQHQMQIVLSVVIILGAAVAALICDLLKGNNERLRELTLELKVRREEESKRFQMLAPPARALAAPAPAQATAKAPAPPIGRSAKARTGPVGPALLEHREASAEPVLSKERSAVQANVQASSLEPQTVRCALPEEPGTSKQPGTLEASAEPVLSQQRSVVQATSSEAAQQPEEPAAAPLPIAPISKRPERSKRPMAPEVLACIRRGEQLAAEPRPRRVPDRAAFEHSAVDEPAAIAPQMQVVQPEVERTEVIQAKVMPPAEAPVTAAKSAGASRDWNSLLKARPQPAVSESVRKYRKAAASASAASEQLSEQRRAEPVLPAGFQDGFVLTRLMESRQPVSGLVVSIGASAPQETNLSQPDDFRALVQSLIGPGDFAAQSGPDEFLLIYPGERGASAQRRLSQIAERLWDFQLSSVASLSVLFSWGGVEVRSESIDEAIASATERMQEARRGRRVLTMEPRADAPLRRAV